VWQQFQEHALTFKEKTDVKFDRKLCSETMNYCQCILQTQFPNINVFQYTSKGDEVNGADGDICGDRLIRDGDAACSDGTAAGSGDCGIAVKLKSLTDDFSMITLSLLLSSNRIFFFMTVFRYMLPYNSGQNEFKYGQYR
jgi:hypothetical protein